MESTPERAQPTSASSSFWRKRRQRQRLRQKDRIGRKSPLAPAKAKAPAEGALERSRSGEEQLPTGSNPERNVETISPTAAVDFGEGSGVQILDLNTGKSIRVHQRTIASYHWLCSIDFHNVLDVSRTAVHSYSRTRSVRSFVCIKFANERTAFVRPQLLPRRFHEATRAPGYFQHV